MKKDTILKEISKETIKIVLEILFNEKLENIEFLDIEFQKIESKRSDILIKSNDTLYHIEFQSTNQKNFEFRMLRYYTEIKQKYKLPLKQFVIYHSSKKCNIKNYIKDFCIDYSFYLIDTNKIDCEKFLNEDNPKAVIMAILCKIKDKSQIEKIIQKIEKLSKSFEEFSTYMLMLEELADKKYKNIIKEIEMNIVNPKWEDFPSYWVGMEKGMEKGIEEGIKKGEKIGIKKGEKIGMLKGRVITLKELGLDNKEIAKKCNISIEKVEKILKELK